MSSSTAAVRLPPVSKPDVHRSREAIARPTTIAIILLAAGVAIWWASLSDIALGQMTDLGLGSVLPIGTWISFGLVTVGCGLAWWYGSDTLIVGAILVTIFVFFGLGVLGEPTMRFATTWQHVGITDYIATHGYVNPDIDAYFNWPGFFILSALISRTAGLHNIEPIARAAPLFFNAMYLIPLVSIARSLCTDRRVIWLGVWLFFVNNWIGQDYYSPQGAGFFMFLALIAVLLKWFKGMPRSEDARRRWSSWRVVARLSRVPQALTRNAEIPADAASTSSQRVVLIIAIALISIWAAASHEFTPPAMVASTAALSLIGWCRLRTLPVAICLVALVWAAFMAVAYLAGNLHSLTQSVGAIGSTVNSNVGGRINGSPGHELIVKLRLVTTAILWITAGLGFLKQARARRLNSGLLVLAAAAFPLLALQSYGGEALLRIDLFSMPFMALAAASLFVPVRQEVGVSKVALSALACFSLVLIFWFPFNRYGNEKMDYFSSDEVASVQAMYRLAPVGSHLFAANYGLPWRFEKYASYYYYDSLTGGASQVDLDIKNPKTLAKQVAAFMRPPAGLRSYLILTKSENAEFDLFGPWRTGSVLRLRRILSSSRYFRTVYSNPDGVVFELK